MLFILFVHNRNVVSTEAKNSFGWQNDPVQRKALFLKNKLCGKADITFWLCIKVISRA